jgi:hypothetical protein
VSFEPKLKLVWHPQTKTKTNQTLEPQSHYELALTIWFWAQAMRMLVSRLGQHARFADMGFSLPSKL